MRGSLSDKKHARRNVGISPTLVHKLRAHPAQADESPDALVFATRNRTPLDPDNMRKRMLTPLMEEIGAPWAAFRTLRHTYASPQLSRRVQSRWSAQHTIEKALSQP